MTDLTLQHVRAVLADRILDDARIVVEGGRIVSIDTNNTDDRRAVDGSNLLVVPGLVDVHSDGLEKEITPRRTAPFPHSYALVSFEGRLRSAGVTTVFHGLAYQDRPRLGRSVETARAIERVIVERSDDEQAAVDHRILYRFEARDATALAPLLDDLGRSNGRVTTPPLVSFEDHTPGQGQYRDLAQFAAAIDPGETPDGMSVDDYVRKLAADADDLMHIRNRNLAALSPLAQRGLIRLLAHDADDETAIAAAHDAGARVAEFPVTIEAAAAARERGMTIVMGAPNALRGHSHSGNASARALVEAGLCDVIASDYMPSALLACAFEMATSTQRPLPEMVAMITRGPATMAGLTDRGRIEVGARADLVLVDDRGRWPSVVGTHRADDHVRRRVLVG